MYLYKHFFLFFIEVARLNSNWAFSSLIFLLHDLTKHFLSCLPLFLKVIYPLCFPELLQKLPTHPGQSSSLTTCLSVHMDSLFLHFQDFFLVFKSCFPKHSPNQSVEKAKVCPLEVQCTSFVDVSSCFTKYYVVYYFMMTVPQMPSDHHISHQPSLFVNSRSSGVLLLSEARPAPW